MNQSCESRSLVFTGTKINNYFCLKQGQGLKGSVAHLYPLPRGVHISIWSSQMTWRPLILDPCYYHPVLHVYSPVEDLWRNRTFTSAQPGTELRKVNVRSESLDQHVSTATLHITYPIEGEGKYIILPIIASSQLDYCRHPWDCESTILESNRY